MSEAEPPEAWPSASPKASRDQPYDWNQHSAQPPRASRVLLLDETLRDGIQSPSVCDPSIEDKLQIVHLLDQLGVEHVTLAMPGGGQRAFDDALRLAQEIANHRLRIRPGCAARTVVQDIRPIAEIAQRSGIAIEVMAFIGSSPIRLDAEAWDVPRLTRLSTEAVDFAVRSGLPCCFVTEDTTRAQPELLELLFRSVLDCGAQRLCLCDTVGHATPEGVRSLLAFTRGVIDRMGLSHPIGIDWHGHNDRGLALINALCALQSGADRVHGTVLGIGERVGNVALDQLLLNLQRLRLLPLGRDLSRLSDLVQRVARACGVPIPSQYPVRAAGGADHADGLRRSSI